MKPTQLLEASYLGDSVYIGKHPDVDSIVLITYNGGASASNLIHLDPTVSQSLLDYLVGQGFKPRDSKYPAS